MTDLRQWMNDLQATDPQLRERAAEALARMGEEARPAAIPLVRSTGDESESVREWAVAALEELGPPDAADCEPLAELANDDNPDVAYWAVTLLGRLQSQASSVAESLARIVSASPHLNVQQRAAWALGQIRCDSPRVREALQQAANSDDPRLARLAGQALTQIEAG